SFNSLCFRLHLQNRLFEVHVDGKLVRELKRERVILLLKLHVLSEDIKQLLMQLDHALGVALADLGGLIFKEHYLAAKKRALLVQLFDLKALPALDHDIEPAIVIALDHVDDRGGAADFGQRALAGAYQAERLLFRETLIDQLAIARLKDMEG